MFDSMQGGVVELDAAAAAAAVSAAHAAVLARECELFALAAHWADLHAPVDGPDSITRSAGGPRAVWLGGPGTPEIVEFAAAEFGVRLETTTRASESLIADALDVRHRLPRLWRMVMSGGVRVWRVRKVAQATRHLSVEAAGLVDDAVADSVALLSWARFENVLDAQIIAADPRGAEEQARLYEADRFVRASQSRGGLKTLVARANAGDVILFTATVGRIADILAARGDEAPADVRRSKAIGILAQPAKALQLLWDHRDDQADPDLPDEATTPDGEPTLTVLPPGVDPTRVKPKAVLYIHLSAEALSSGAGVARFEDAGPVTVAQVWRWLAGTGCDVRVQPVIDLAAEDTAVDAYEVPRRLREQQRLRTPASCFPYSAATSRRMDLDHTVPYLSPDRGRPPGQTSIGNLGPLTRREHRVKTHSRWRVRQPEPDTFVWRSAYGACFIVTRAGTLNLGDGEFSRALWLTACAVKPPDRSRALKIIDHHWPVGPTIHLEEAG